MILETIMRNALADEFDNYINTTGTGTAKIEFQIAASTEVATINLQNPAFGAAATGAIALAGVTLSDTSATGNASPVTKAALFNRTPTKVAEFSAGTGAEEISLSSAIIGATDQVDLTGLTVTVPAS